MKPYWSLETAFFYILLGLLAMWVVEISCNKKEFRNWNVYLFIWIIVWTIIAAFRKVAIGIGGTDALNYIDFFYRCNQSSNDEIFLHLSDDMGYYWINKILNFICPNHYFFFIVVYGFMVYSFALFYKVFVPVKTNLLPYILTVYLFVRGFNTLRSNLAISIILIAIVLFYYKKYWWTFVFSIIAVSVHKASLLFVLLFPIVYLFKNRTISSSSILLLFILSFLLSNSLRIFVLNFFNGMSFEGAYSSYISSDKNLLDIWGIFFEQLLLGAFLLFCNKKIQIYKNSLSIEFFNKVDLIYQLCVFDIILVPINIALGNWRGYEFFYLPRIIMWGILLYIILKNQPQRFRLIFSFSLFIIIGFWLLFRWNSTYEDSSLMPYVFSLL